jgi:hypothetical protein
MGRRWSYIPWTEVMEQSRQPWRVMVRFWNENVDDDVETKPTVDARVKA